MENNKKQKILFAASLVAVIGSLTLLGISYAWFSQQRQMTTLTWIKTPIILNIGSGDNHDIQYLDMGDIDVQGEADYKDYVVCVYGSPVDNYSLQLAYTTNIPFHYEVYRAEKNDNGEIIYKYTDKDEEKEEHYTIVGKSPVIDGLSMNEVLAKNGSPSNYQSHKLSYGDEKGEHEVSASKVQAYNEPFYFLASENGVSAMTPSNIGTDTSGKQYFLDYYVIRISWTKGQVLNNKETDIVYLTASR